MTVEVFLFLLMFFSVVTSLFTEGAKKLLESLHISFASNVLVLCVAAFVGGFGMVIFYILCGYSWTAANFVCIFLMIVANWLGSMVGYDKVKQAITQIIGGKNHG